MSDTEKGVQHSKWSSSGLSASSEAFRSAFFVSRFEGVGDSRGYQFLALAIPGVIALLLCCEVWVPICVLAQKYRKECVSKRVSGPNCPAVCLSNV